jgi:hemolysin III
MRNLILEEKEELANILTHGMGVLFAIVAIPLLISNAVNLNSWQEIIGVSIYTFSFLLVFSMSTIYHSIFDPNFKKVFKILDHMSIYFLIAGTYTPLILFFSNSLSGTVLLSGLWGISLFGIIFKLFFIDKFEIVSVIIYLLMGWSILILPSTFFEAIPSLCHNLIMAGGIFYSVGVVFYLWRKLRYNHAVWHVFVLIGGVCHFGAVGLAVFN